MNKLKIKILHKLLSEYAATGWQMNPLRPLPPINTPERGILDICHAVGSTVEKKYERMEAVENV